MKSDKRTGQLAAPSQRWKGSYQLGIKQRDLEVYDRITTCKINQSSGATFVLILQDFHAPSIEWPWWTMNDHQWPQINYTMRWSPLASHLAWYAAHAVLTLWLVLYQWLPFSWLLSNCWVWRTFVTLWFELEDWQTLQRAPTFAGKPIKGINFGQFAALQKETWRPMIRLKTTKHDQSIHQSTNQSNSHVWQHLSRSYLQDLYAPSVEWPWWTMMTMNGLATYRPLPSHTIHEHSMFPQRGWARCPQSLVGLVRLAAAFLGPDIRNIP